jgi:polyphosphate kinase 2 (PPK2 family)
MYEDCFAHCNKIPWHIIPADQNWYKDHLVAVELHKLIEFAKDEIPDYLIN